jgi:Tol biopolymer transport system component
MFHRIIGRDRTEEPSPARGGRRPTPRRAVLGCEPCEGRVLLSVSLASVNAAGTASGDGLSEGPVLSADGRYVAFTSSATDLTATPDANGAGDVFVRDLVAGTTTLVSVGATGTAAGNGSSGSPVLSADGRYVAFTSSATDLTATPKSNGVSDVFVRDLVMGTTELVSVNAAGNAAGNGSSYGTDFSGDGRYLVFMSYASDLTATPDTNNTTPDSFGSDVFVRDLVTATTTLVSVNAAGNAAGNGSSYDTDFSGDGRYVAFTSYATDLTATPDANGAGNVFVRDLVAEATTLVSVDVTGNKAGNDNSFRPVFSADGRHVAFTSFAENLTAVPDSNNQIDVFIAPVPAPPPAGPPMITRLRRFGIHARPTRLVLSFDEAMDPARSSRVANYRLVAPGPDRRFGTRDDRRIWIRSATYDAALREVTLAPRSRLALRQGYRLTVVGSAPSGLADESGEFLDGGGTGRGGSDFVADFGGEALVRPAAVGAAARRAAMRRR